ncbi:PHD finger protein rhinoceros isoform X2 [Drosophila kikkawai]|uniref:PHD finger protein rhinoceros isoform X2 n=1 Tax=Drosophila kikkawai TaxID=30033 RepID=A0ABM4GIZ8_DROKI
MEATEQDVMLEGSEDLMSTSATSTNGSDTNGCGKKSSATSPDPTSYVAKARVTRPTPPAPSKNPMQFVQIKPCNLYQTAQQQLKKAEEVKKLKEVKKEEPEEWQNNLDNWKSSRRKRVEHIIDRVVETKKLELEEHDRMRRKSKTFTEMMEERAERGGPRGRAKLASLAVYNEDETNDLSDLGIGTSSASGKSSLSEDYDNNSVMSDNAAELDKAIGAAGSGAAGAASRNVDEQQNHINRNGSNGNHNNGVAVGQASTSNASKAAGREYISSPGYDTSSSTAPASSPDPCEYTYEGAIQDYKQRVQRASSNGNANANGKVNGEPIAYPTRRGSKIEDRLSGFEVTSPSDTQEGVEKQKVDVPKVDISKRKEIFEQAKSSSSHGAASAAPKVVLRDRLTNGNGGAPAGFKPEVKRLSGDISSIRDRMQSLEQQRNAFNSSKSVDVPVPPLKQRLNSLQQSVTKEEQKKPPLVALIDARQLEIMRGEEERMRQQQQQKKEQHLAQHQTTVASPPTAAPPALIIEEPPATSANDDSGIQEDTSEELQQQQQQLNAAIAALALEERQLEEAANAVNQIEAEFDELTDLNPSPLPPSPARPAAQTSSSSPSSSSAASAPIQAANQAAAPPLRDMEFSINEALELALEAIDRETTPRPMDKAQQLAEKPEEEEEEHHNEKQQEDSKQEPKSEPEQGGTHTEGGGDMPNKTDEQKQGEREPIYENVSSTISMHEVDNEQIATMTITTQTQAATRRSHRRSIPNNQTSNSNNNENNQNTNQTNSNSNNSNQSENNPAAAAATATAPPLAPIVPPTASAAAGEAEPYYQVPKATEPYYDAPKHLRPVPVYENIEIFYSGLEISQGSALPPVGLMEPPKEKPPPPPTESPPPVPVRDSRVDELDGLDSSLGHNTDTWSSDNTYETISNGTRRQLQGQLLEPAQPSPPIKRMNSTKRIKKELRNKRSSFLGIETDGDLDDMESYLELTVAPPPDMAQLLQEERRLEKQLYIKAGLCDSSDTGDSRDSGVSENHSRQSSEHYTNSSEENDTQSEATPPPLPPPPATTHLGEVIYQNENLLLAAQTPLLQTVKGNSAESWTESATAAAAATQSLSEATATANAKMQSIEEKIREQGEVLRVERELLHFSQEELKRQRENLLLRENLARRELQHGAKMLMSNNRRSLQDLHHGLGIGNGMLSAFQPPPPPQHHQQPLHPTHPQQIYANVPQQQQQQQQQKAALYAYHQMDTDYRKSMSDLNEFSNRLMLPPTPPTKPLRAMHIAAANGHGLEPDYAVSTRQRQPPVPYGGSLVKIAGAPMGPRLSGPGYPVQASAAAAYHHQSAQNLSNMSRNTLLALSATPKPKYTDGWVQVQQRKSYDSNLANDPAWLSAQQQKRKSMPDYGGAVYNNNHWLLQEAEQRRIDQLNRRSMPASKSNGKPLPDSIIQTLTERVQSKGIGERKRFDGNGNYSQVNGNTNNGYQQQPHQQQQQQPQHPQKTNSSSNNNNNSNGSQEKVLSVSGKKKCSHCGDELGKLCYYVGYLGCTHDNCRQVHKALKYIVWV